RAVVAETPSLAVCGQFRIWRVVDRETGAHITVTVDTTTGPLAPRHRVAGLYAWLPSANAAVRDAGIEHAPASVRHDAHAAFLWARGVVRARVRLAETLEPLGVALADRASAPGTSR
ncbi:MAG TPA: hypothetical protein VF594_10850, partial [Rubricoccaceae bacterium]